MKISDKFPEIVRDVPNLYEDVESQFIVAEQIENGRSIGALVTSRAAERDGAVVHWHGGYTAIAEKAGARVLLRGHMCTDTATGGQIVRDKFLTKALLQKAGVATPRGGLATTPEEAVRVQQQLGSAVVVKPRFGGQGKGVTVNVESALDIRDAFWAIPNRDQGVLVEEYINGVEFRLLATPEECFGAVRRLLPHVEGDGLSSIAELVDKKNELRKRNPNNCKLPIPVDRTMDKHLQRHGFTLSSILPEGKRIIVRNVGGISSGGEASECLDLLESAVLDLASNAMRAIPTMEWGGADILLSEETGLPYILEVNTNAAISNSTFPVYGRPKDVGEAAWSRMFRRAQIDDERREVAVPLGAPVSVKEALAPRWPEGLSYTPDLMSLLIAHLKHLGWAVEQKSDRLMRAHKADEADKWYRGPLDERFPARVTSLLRRHHTVRSILRAAKVPVPRAIYVRNVEDISAYRERAQVELALVPRELGWAGQKIYYEGGDSLGASSSSRVLAQRRSSGMHVRVVSSRDQALAILCGEPAFLPTPDQSRLISLTAIDAVRAIPGLPWAEVDLVVTNSVKAGIQVEGLSVQRNLAGFDYVCAGSIESALDIIANA